MELNVKVYTRQSQWFWLLTVSFKPYYMGCDTCVLGCRWGSCHLPWFVNSDDITALHILCLVMLNYHDHSRLVYGRTELGEWLLHGSSHWLLMPVKISGHRDILTFYWFQLHRQTRFISVQVRTGQQYNLYWGSRNKMLSQVWSRSDKVVEWEGMTVVIAHT